MTRCAFYRLIHLSTRRDRRLALTLIICVIWWSAALVLRH